jgi:hypothetical protein
MQSFSQTWAAYFEQVGKLTLWWQLVAWYKLLKFN